MNHSFTQPFVDKWSHVVLAKFKGLRAHPSKYSLAICLTAVGIQIKPCKLGMGWSHKYSVAFSVLFCFWGRLIRNPHWFFPTEVLVQKHLQLSWCTLLHGVWWEHVHLGSLMITSYSSKWQSANVDECLGDASVNDHDGRIFPGERKWWDFWKCQFSINEEQICKKQLVTIEWSNRT